jgi:hypothetical protein
MRDPAYIARMKKGPVVLMTVFGSDPIQMGNRLARWFVFCLVVALFAAYLTSRAVPAGAPYMDVFRFASAVAFVGHGLGQWPSTIWYDRAWQTSLRNTIDALVYGLLTGGAVGWLWP